MALVPFFGALVMSAALAETPPHDLLIETIEVTGLVRTDERIPRRALGLAPGDRINPAVLDNALRRVKNLRLFAKVHGDIVVLGTGRAAVVLKVEEKWTWLPVLRGGAGGGVWYYVIGTYDINAFGRYSELGAQNTNIGGDNSFSLWNYNPRFLFSEYSLDTALHYIHERRWVYGDHREKIGAYHLRRVRIESSVGRDFREWLRGEVRLVFEDDVVSSNALSNEQLAVNSLNGYRPGSRGLSLSLTPILHLGRLDYDQEMVRGFRLSVGITGRGQDSGTLERYEAYDATVLGFVQPSPWLNLGMRLGWAFTTAHEAPYTLVMGGFEHVRGFLDGEFSGDRMLFGNFEARSTFLRTKHVFFQQAFFTDMGRAAWGSENLFNAWPVSLGLGVRAVLPYISRVVVRLDYAWVVNPVWDSGISISLRQFF